MNEFAHAAAGKVSGRTHGVLCRATACGGLLLGILGLVQGKRLLATLALTRCSAPNAWHAHNVRPGWPSPTHLPNTHPPTRKKDHHPLHTPVLSSAQTVIGPMRVQLLRSHHHQADTPLAPLQNHDATSKTLQRGVLECCGLATHGQPPCPACMLPAQTAAPPPSAPRSQPQPFGQCRQAYFSGTASAGWHHRNVLVFGCTAPAADRPHSAGRAPGHQRPRVGNMGLPPTACMRWSRCAVSAAAAHACTYTHARLHSFPAGTSCSSSQTFCPQPGPWAAPTRTFRGRMIPH